MMSTGFDHGFHLLSCFYFSYYTNYPLPGKKTTAKKRVGGWGRRQRRKEWPKPFCISQITSLSLVKIDVQRRNWIPKQWLNNGMVPNFLTGSLSGGPCHNQRDMWLSCHPQKTILYLSVKWNCYWRWKCGEWILVSAKSEKWLRWGGGKGGRVIGGPH